MWTSTYQSPLLGLGQAELRNLQGEHIDFERQQIMVRRQKTQRMPLCQQKNGCALTALDCNYGIKPRALPWAVLWRPFRPCIRTAMLESHGFSIAGTAQGLRYGRLGSLRYNGLPWSCRFHDEISGLELTNAFRKFKLAGNRWEDATPLG
jgi:hypothetical protein